MPERAIRPVYNRRFANFRLIMRLVIQGPRLGPAHLAHLATLGATNLTRVSEQVCIGESPRRDDIAQYCAQQGLDSAFVPEDAAWDHIGLVVMDMDSTLINIECIDEIADMQGLKPQVCSRLSFLRSTGCS